MHFLAPRSTSIIAPALQNAPFSAPLCHFVIPVFVPGFFFDRCLLSGCRLEQPRPPPPLRPCVAPSCLWIDVRLKVARVPRLLPHRPRPPSHYCTTHFSHFERYNSGKTLTFLRITSPNNKTTGLLSDPSPPRHGPEGPTWSVPLRTLTQRCRQSLLLRLTWCRHRRRCRGKQGVNRRHRHRLRDPPQSFLLLLSSCNENCK